MWPCDARLLAMEDAKTSGRSKRQPRAAEDDESWDCSVCTYKNTAGAFKCQMCDTRKGTSTRKPKINQQQIVIHQASQQLNQSLARKQKSPRQTPGPSPKVWRPARLKNVDRSTAQHMAVTVGDVTVIITDYKPKTTSPSDSYSSSEQSCSAAEDGSSAGNGGGGGSSNGPFSSDEDASSASA